MNNTLSDHTSDLHLGGAENTTGFDSRRRYILPIIREKNLGNGLFRPLFPCVRGVFSGRNLRPIDITRATTLFHLISISYVKH